MRILYKNPQHRQSGAGCDTGIATIVVAIALLGVLWPLMALAITLFALNMYDYRMFAVNTKHYVLLGF